MKIATLIVSAAFATALLVSPTASFSKQTGAAQTASAPPHSKAESSSAPSAQEISDAKAKGLVWVNTSTHVYHKDGDFYGTTKHGKFMTEDDAKKVGFRAAKTSGSKSKKPQGTSTATSQ